MSKRNVRSVQVLVGLLLVGVNWTASVATLMAQAPPAVESSLPKDVFPETRNRLAPIKRENLDERHAKAYDAAAANSPSGVPQGIAAMRLHGSGMDMRWEAPLGRGFAELVILEAAREQDQPFEWTVHELEAIGWGLDPKTIDLVRYRKPMKGADPRHAVAVEIAREILIKHKLSSETYARGVKLLGEPQFVDVVGLTGQYSGSAVGMSMFNSHLPAEMKQLLPLPFTMPDDIHPDSRSRLSLKRRPPLGFTSLYSREIAPSGTGPNLISAHQAGMKALETNVGPRLMALAGLVTVREFDNQYYWTMTELAARKAGLDSAIIEIVRDRKPVTGLGEKETAIIEFGRQLIIKHNVTAETYARTAKLFSDADLADLTALMGRYFADGSYWIAFDQQLPVGQEPLLPTR